jgi:FAD-linked oxidoreductase
MEIRNWSGSVCFRPRQVLAPASLGELRQLVRSHPRGGARIRAMGARHSFTPLIETPDTLLSLASLAGLSEVDAEACVWTGAGTGLRALGEALLKAGRAQENLGDINAQSLAGAVSTGTHGTGLRFGSVSTQAEALEIVGADGEPRLARRGDELFDAAGVSLGALGLLARVRLRTVPAYKLRVRQFVEPLDEALAKFEARNREHRHFEFFWFPYTDAALSKLSDETPDAPNANAARDWFNDVLVENVAFELFHRVALAGWADAPTINRLIVKLARSAASKEKVDWSARAFSTHRLSRFQESEWGLPLEALPEFFPRLRRLCEENKYPSTFPVEVRAVRADDFWLSPAYKRDTVFVAAHMYHRLPRDPYFADFRRLCLEFGGRPHWGKLHGLGPGDFAALYPRWDDFLALRRELDPDGLFNVPSVFGENP